MNIPHLGIHSKYELCNGSRSFEDYIAKAKFLQIDTLGIVDVNTLGGAFAFQVACQKAGINFVLGETVTVRRKDQHYTLKLYVKNSKGWANLLRISKSIRVDNGGHINEPDLLNLGSGLFCVIPVDSAQSFNRSHFYKIKEHFEEVFWQLDVTEWTSNERDKNYLLNVQHFFRELYPACKPVLIHDSYYLDKDEAHIKAKLNTIGKYDKEFSSTDQYFKNYKELFLSLSEAFKLEDDRLYDLYEESASNALKIAEKCKFEIETGKLRLPKYKMTDSEVKLYGDAHNMFDVLVAEGLSRIGKGQNLIYTERIEYEKKVIDLGGYRDYFLITYDIIRFAKGAQIPVNLGRGSAASSLCLYCLDVTGIDPVQYDLPFDRFLNSERVKSGLPDCDLDFSSEKRDIVKSYIIEKYGFNHVAFAGNYGLLKIKSALKEVAKVDGISFQDINYVTGMFPKKDDPENITQFFKYTAETPNLKSFVKDNVSIINDTFLIEDSIKNLGEHASAVIIFPEHDEHGNEMNVWDWVPCRKQDNHLTTDFSGVELEKLGFLKEDILGLSQLDKNQQIFDLIRINKGKEYTLTNIPLDDEKTYSMFQEGYTQDIFQFNGDGITHFLMELLPENIDHLIAANALYRPGAMGVSGHTVYAQVKNGIKNPEYLWGHEEITKGTYGIICYQEQVMRACVELADFSMADADNIRKAIGKSNRELLDSYKAKFTQEILKKGCELKEAEKIWHTFESFGSYAFNLSHAACYTILSYDSMYLKTNYPVEFYSVALQFANDDNRPKIIAEMNRLGGVKVMQPSINESGVTFKPDFNNNKIYWSLPSVKWVGVKAVEKIIEERDKNGEYFSVRDLFDRVDKRTVNKRAVSNLIIAGAFDEVYKIKSESERIGILREFFELILKEQLPEEFKDFDKIPNNWWWVLKGKELTGLGFIRYEEVIPASFDKKKIIKPLKFHLEESRGNDVVVCGVINKATERQSKRGKFLTIELEHNSEIINVLIWNELYEKYKANFRKSEGKIMFMSGQIKYDSFKGVNGVQSDDETKIEIL